MSKRYLITSALPYANGPLHFGHLAGVYLPADIVTRHFKLKGEKVLHISGSDEHGVAIMQNAQKEKKDYQEYVDAWHKDHKNLFDQYEIEFDFFGQTSKEYHHTETLQWFEKIDQQGYIQRQEEKQLQCQDCHQFLPDRFVHGKCYECGYEQARGDECPSCGTWIDPLKLIDPECQFCHSHNIKTVDSYQYYLMLSQFHEPFLQWLKTKKGHWKKAVYPYLYSLCEEDLHDRAITRDLDWGVKVPIAGQEKKRLYVWFDAPIGYVSNTKEFLRVSGSDEHYLKDWWNHPETEIINFIGKDNLIFHGIIFPVMCQMKGDVKSVDFLAANQYVNLMGKQFSKSTGWTVDAKEALDQFGSTALRYYLISLIPETTDSSFSWSGLESKINNELANNIGNFINRGMKFLTKNWPEGVSIEFLRAFLQSGLYGQLKSLIDECHQHLQRCEVKLAMEKVMHCGHLSNLYFSENKPWAVIKEDPDEAQKIIAHSALLSYFLAVFLKPFLPQLSQEILSLFPEELSSDQAVKQVYSGQIETVLGNFSASKLKLMKEPQALVPKIDKKLVAQLEESLNER